MVRVVSQKVYDEVVKEYIEEFSMCPEEAIAEAIKEFEAQVRLIFLYADLYAFRFNVFDES